MFETIKTSYHKGKALNAITILFKALNALSARGDDKEVVEVTQELGKQIFKLTKIKEKDYFKENLMPLNNKGETVFDLNSSYLGWWN